MLFTLHFLFNKCAAFGYMDEMLEFGSLGDIIWVAFNENMQYNEGVIYFSLCGKGGFGLVWMLRYNSCWIMDDAGMRCAVIA